MNTFKTAVVLATLLGVGYGVHIVLNKPPAREQSELDGYPQIDFDGWPNPDNATVADGDPNANFNGLPMPDGANPSDNATAGFATAESTNVGQAAPPLVAATSANPTVEYQETVSSPPVDGSVASAAFPALSQQTPIANASAGESLAQTTVSPATEVQPTPPSFGQPPSNPIALSPSNQDASTIAANQSAFEQIWLSAQSKLATGNYAEALFTLSLWYSDPNLTSEQRDRLIPLLDDLAGRVIYSAESLQDPPHTVQAGETLGQMAAKYAVTSQFLARVNGFDRNVVLTPGQQIKIVRGPFRGELSLNRREITVFVGRLYAGRFSVGVGRELPLGEMSLEVAEKSGARAHVDAQTGTQIPAGDPTNPYGDYWIGLRSPGAPVNPDLGIHSTGERVEASDTRGCISLSNRDADDLQAIFSIGSRFTIIR